MTRLLLILAALIALAIGPAHADPVRVLVYGDSNSWGWIPSAQGAPTQRHPARSRWPDVMAQALGEGFDVDVDALSGRTVDVGYAEPVGALPGEAFNGRRALPSALAAALPVDVLVIMLGTNDLRPSLSRTPEDIAGSLRRLVEEIPTYQAGVLTTYTAPQVLVVAPPPLGDVSRTPIRGVMAGAEANSSRLGEAIAAAFQGSRARVFNAGAVITTDGIDGVHFSAAAHQRLGSALANEVRALLDGNRVRVGEGVGFINGVAFDASGDLFVGGNLSGAILRRSSDGEWTKFFAGDETHVSVTSLRFDPRTNLLWGTAPDVLGVIGRTAGRPNRPHRVFALDAANGRLAASVVIPDGGFGNDLALDGEGGVFVTDSLRGRVWRISRDGRRISLAAEDQRFRSGALGPAGIVRTSDGDIIVGLFSAGELYRVHNPGWRARITPIPLPRPFLRLDGLAFAPDGRLLAIEGGAGALHAVDLDTGVITTLATGLFGPVNLTVYDNAAWITESSITDPATFDPARPPASGFFVRRVPLQQ